MISQQLTSAEAGFSIWTLSSWKCVIVFERLSSIQLLDLPRLVCNSRRLMIQWYVQVRRLLRDIERKSQDALALHRSGRKEAAASVNAYLKSDYQKLEELWTGHFTDGMPSYLGRHIGFGMEGDYEDILKHDLLEVESKAEEALVANAKKQGELGFENLLHPIIKESSYKLYRQNNLREAVLNSVTAIFDHIRGLTGANLDGSALADRVFSLNDPYIVFSELESESGQNDQKGFLQIYKGAFQGIRNPKAHSLTHDLTPEKAAQYLVFASLLARRLDEARVIKADKKA